MNQRSRTLLFGLILVLVAGQARSQRNPDTAGTSRHTVFNLGLDYFSNLTFGGRYDSVQLPILTPSFTVVTKPGLFLGIVAYEDLGKVHPGMEGISLTPGYAWHIHSHWLALFSYSRFFITDKSPMILASLKSLADAGFYFTSPALNISLEGDYLFGNNKDWINTLDISHDIKWKRILPHLALRISPALSLIAGTQTFYRTYYTNLKNGNLLTGNGGLLGGLTGGSTPPLTSTQQEQVRSYQLLSGELSLPVVFRFDHSWRLRGAPHLLIPMNQPGSLTGNFDHTLFYMTLGASYSF